LGLDVKSSTWMSFSSKLRRLHNVWSLWSDKYLV